MLKIISQGEDLSDDDLSFGLDPVLEQAFREHRYEVLLRKFLWGLTLIIVVVTIIYAAFSAKQGLVQNKAAAEMATEETTQ